MAAAESMLATTSTTCEQRAENMATKSRTIHYPESDGEPMAETPVHRNNMADLIGTLGYRYAKEKKVYVSGNMMMYYVKGNPRKSVSPDMFVVFGIPKLPEREVYLVWKEGKGPDVAFEITSKSTRKEDTVFKKELYQDVLKVKEYFLFDPYAEYLDPPLQGHRLRRGRYQDIQSVKGRLPSEMLGLHLERAGHQLRLYDPVTDSWLPILTDHISNVEDLTRLVDAYRARAELHEQRADRAEQAQKRLEVEVEQMRREFEDMRRRLGQRNGKNGK
jgi:Uma2 family endonuclease